LRLVWQPEAGRDLDDIWDYTYGHWGTARADANIGDIRLKAEALANQTLPGISADDVRPGLRRLLVGTHAIWFRIEGVRVRVNRVLHQSLEAGLWIG
jgi:toxin ParE1/3/4